MTKPRRPPSWSRAPTAWARTPRTPTTPAATPPPRAPRPTRSPASTSSCCGSRAPAVTSARSPRRPGRAAAGPDARARRRLPRRRPRGRDGRGLRLLPARQGRRRAVDRHRDARPRRRRARRPPAPRLRHRDRDLGRRRGADPEIFGDQVVWVPWRRPGFQLGLDIAEIKAEQPAGRRLHPRRPRHHRVGRHQRGVRGQLALDHRHRRDLHRRAHAGPSRSVRPLDGYAALPDAERRARAAALAPTIRGIASADRPMVGHFTDADVVLDFLGRRAPAARRARHVVPRPLPPHQGQAAGPRPAGLPPRSRSHRPAPGAAVAYREDYQGYYDRNATRTAPRSAARTRWSCWCPASACSASARTSRPPASPASSTSTRST